MPDLPGPSCLPGLTGTPISPPGPGVIDGVLQSATSVIAQAIGQATSSIKTLFDQAIATVQGSIQTAARSVASLQGQAETTYQLAANQAQTAVGQAVSRVTSPQAGSTVGQGAKPGQYTFNVFALLVATGWTDSAIFSKQQAILLAGSPGYCFLGGWDLFADALAFSQSPAFTQLATSCTYPGGPTQPTNGGPVSGCQQWAVWVFPAGATSLCSYPYCDGSVPDPSGLGGSKHLFATQDAANAFAASATCTVPPVIGTGGPQYYGGCAGGAPTTWAVGTPAPTGVSGQVGPFPDQATALTAAGTCAPINPPPTSGTGQCCGVDPNTGALVLPSCISIDLCDWGKFTDALAKGIYKGLCLWTADDSCCHDPLVKILCDGLCEWVKSPTCQCFFHESNKWAIEDCQGEFGNEVNGWLGSTGSMLAGSLDEIVAKAQGYGG